MRSTSGVHFSVTPLWTERNTYWLLPVTHKYLLDFGAQVGYNGLKHNVFSGGIILAGGPPLLSIFLFRQT